MKIMFLEQTGIAPLIYFVNLAHTKTPLNTVYSGFPEIL